jgi:hypothetical protein
VRRTKGGTKGAEAHCPDVKEVEKTFWLSRPDGWVINKKTKRIIMLEFKRVSDTAETYYSDMQSIVERQHTPILEGLNAPGRRAGMGGGSSTSSDRTALGQGKRVANIGGVDFSTFSSFPCFYSSVFCLIVFILLQINETERTP